MTSNVTNYAAVTNTNQIKMQDPRKSGQVGIGAFYLPGYLEEWDKICHCGFCGNF